MPIRRCIDKPQAIASATCSSIHPTLADGTRPSRFSAWSLLRCSGPGSAYRLGQIIAASALCLELSAAASAATAGSENFALAHLAASGRTFPEGPDQAPT